jgi:ribose 5-phosphate isomerase B
MTGLRIVVGSDSAGVSYKDAIRADLQHDERVAEVIDIGVTAEGEDLDTPYPNIGFEAGRRIAAGEADRAVLVCGTGLGVAIAANKVPGIRAVTAHDSFSVERSILSNDCHVLTMGERVVGLELARRLAREWVGYAFDRDSPSAAKVARLEELERAAGSVVADASGAGVSCGDPS